MMEVNFGTGYQRVPPAQRVRVSRARVTRPSHKPRWGDDMCHV